MEYNLHKIVIIGHWSLKDRESLQTIALETIGLKILSVLYVDDVNSINADKEDIIESIKSELYDDMYDDDLIIKVKEAYDGKDVVKKLTKFIDKRWNEELQVYYYLPDDKVLDKLIEECMKKNGKIYVDDLYTLFKPSDNISIYDMMKSSGLKTENLMKDSLVSMSYFLSALIEKMLSR